MRSLILVICTLFFLALGFLVYYWLQPQHKEASSHFATTSTASLELRGTPGGGNFGPAEDVWTQVFDQNTGDLARTFKTDSFTRLKDNRYAVTKPMAKFFTSKNHQIVRVLTLEADSGIVTPAHGKQNADPFKAHSMGVPSTGEMHIVTVTIEEPDLKNVLQKVTTITMPNAWFDNESFKIYTQGYTDPEIGTTYAAEWVPVRGVGDDTHPDFEGFGLTLKWNDRDRKLDLLEIAHGRSLTLKHAKKFAPGQAGAQTTAPASAWTPASWPETKLMDGGPMAWAMDQAFERALHVRPLPAMLVDGSGAAAADAIPGADASSPRRRRGPRPMRDPATMPSDTEPREVRGPRHPHDLPDHAKITPSNVSSLYRATFLDEVRIEQSGQPLVTADRMFVDFLMEQERPATQPASAPATGPATAAALAEARAAKPAPATAPAAAPASEPVTGAEHAPRRTTRLAGAQPTTLATTEPAGDGAESDAPIIVYWTGKLIIQPLTESAEVIAPGEEIITLEGTGAPVIARQSNSEIRCAALTYRTQDGTMIAEQGEKIPLTLTTLDARGTPTTIRTAELNYSRPRQMALLRGKGSTEMPAQADGTMLKADWAKTCKIYFTPDEEGRSSVDHAEMEGDVHVLHPQFKLRSDLLDLSFETTRAARRNPATAPARTAQASATEPLALPAPGPTSLPSTRAATNPAASPMNQSNLKQMVATGAVHCDMTDSNKKNQTIDCNRLTVVTIPGPDGKSTPRTILADGDVHTIDPDQDMHAGSLTVQLRPSTRPSTRPSLAAAAAKPGQSVPAAPRVPSTDPTSALEVESMVAHDHVIVVTKDGTRATADQLLVNTVDGKARVKLLGTPSAKIVDKQSTIIGAIISLNPDSQEMTVDGEGEMHAIQQESPGAAPRPMDVFWSRSLLVNGKENFCDAIGSVRAVVNNADGSQDVAKGDHVRMLLADVAGPATRPTTQQAHAGPTTVPAVQPVRVATSSLATLPATQASGGSLNLMGKKTVRQANFYDNAEVSSTLLDANGGLLRRMHVAAATIIYDVIEKNGVSQKKVTIPCPGRMLVEDYRQPATEPAKQGGDDGASNRGATAFQWSKRLVYDDATRQVVLEGSLQDPVLIGHQDAGKSDPMRLSGDTVIADLEPLAPTTKPTTALAASQPASNEPHFQVKLMAAHGHVTLTSKGNQLTADTMVYDPVTHWVRAMGNDRTKAVLTRTVVDFRGTQPISGDEMEYNTVTDESKLTGGSARIHH